MVIFTIVSLFFACLWGFHAEDPIAMFLVIFVPGLVAGFIVAGLVVWVMKAFSEPPQQDSDDEHVDLKDSFKSESRANPPQKNTKTAMKMLICLFLISMMTLIFISMMIVFSQ